jgi:hypothetical protein
MLSLAFLAIILAAPADQVRKNVENVETVGVLRADGDNYALIDDDQEYKLALNDKDPGYKERLKKLPEWVGKLVVVSHRPGRVTIGRSKVLLADTARLLDENARHLEDMLRERMFMEQWDMGWAWYFDPDSGVWYRRYGPPKKE